MQFVWDRTEAFYTGVSAYTYKITFTSTLPAAGNSGTGTVFFDDVAIQTVNGMFNETTAALQNAPVNISCWHRVQMSVSPCNTACMTSATREASTSTRTIVPVGQMVRPRMATWG